VLSPPVAELGTLQQRDPFLLWHEDRWVMLLGTGLRTDDAGGSGAVVAWESTDTYTWSYRGLVFARPGGGDGIDTGPVWECPQLLRVDGAWVLIVSVQMPGPRCPYAVWFVGDFDGLRFRPASTGLMDHGEVFYAPAITEGVLDRTLMWGWLQEGGRGVAPAVGEGTASSPPAFVGAMSLPRELSVRDGRLHSRPALEVVAIWSAPPLARHTDLHIPDGGSVQLAPKLPTSYRLSFELDLTSGRGGVRLGADAEGHPVWLGLVTTSSPRMVAGAWRDGHLSEWYSSPLPASQGPVRVEVYGDAGIIEAFAAGCALTLRVEPGPSRATAVLLDAAGGTAHFRDVALVTAPA
jgi:beta-fructofuranosidase